jgi:mono/diheme cytochrome c family protein
MLAGREGVMATGVRWMWVSGAVLFVATSVMTRATSDGAIQARPAVATPAPAAGDPARGRYLVEHVAMCIECHSGRDEHGRLITAELYRGGAIPPGPPWAVDWPVRAPRNSGLAGYTDEEGRRLLMQGAISRNGQQLRAPMPRFRMTLQDANDVIAFMRSVP